MNKNDLEGKGRGMDLVIKYLCCEPSTAMQISNDLKMPASSVYSILSSAKKSGTVFISDWVKSEKNSSLVPLYSIGSGEDAKRPKKQSEIEKENEIVNMNPFGTIHDHCMGGLNPFASSSAIAAHLRMSSGVKHSPIMGTFDEK